MQELSINAALTAGATRIFRHKIAVSLYFSLFAGNAFVAGPRSTWGFEEPDRSGSCVAL
jgi:hypothetical protein